MRRRSLGDLRPVSEKRYGLDVANGILMVKAEKRRMIREAGKANLAVDRVFAEDGLWR